MVMHNEKQGISLLDLQSIICDWMEKNHQKFESPDKLRRVLIKTINKFDFVNEEMNPSNRKNAISQKINGSVFRLKRAVKELMDFAYEHEELCECELGFCCQLHAAVDSGKHALKGDDE